MEVLDIDYGTRRRIQILFFRMCYLVFEENYTGEDLRRICSNVCAIVAHE
jgi:hypothetical protein